MLHWPSPADQNAEEATEGREVELKFDIEPDQVPLLAELPEFAGEADHQRLISVYFDTMKGKLRRNGWVLRVRQSDGQFVQTIKRSGEAAGLFDRDEWEAGVSALAPDPKAVAKTQLSSVVKARQVRQLLPVCRCDVDRLHRIHPRDTRRHLDEATRRRRPAATHRADAIQ